MALTSETAAQVDWDADPVALQLLWSRLIGVVDEAAVTLVRTSFSPVVQECNDYSCSVMDARGRALAESSSSIPAFIGTLPQTVRYILEHFPGPTWAPGDVVITNNPWHGTGHLLDFSMVSPIFSRDRLAGFAGTVAHAVDIGGLSWASHARSVFEEGLQIPATKLLRAGRRNEELLGIIAANVRYPDQVVGDLLAQVAACETCCRRTRELMDDAGLTELESLSEALQARSDAAMRKAIRAIPDGTYLGESAVDGRSEPLIIKACVAVRGSEITVDYAGTSPQVDWGINSVLNYTFAYTAFPIKCALDPDTPKNEGTYRSIRVSAPVGSILNPTFPAPVAGRHLSGMYCAAAVYQALAQAVPDRVIAESSGPPARPVVVGAGPDGRDRGLVIFAWGGMGARANADGLSCTAFPGNDKCAAVETMERTAPVRFHRKALVTDSGGIGRRRGGLGQEIVFEYRGSRPGYITMMSARIQSPPRGLLGGGDGLPTAYHVNGRPADPNGRTELAFGDIVTICFPGGGGYGAPEDRDAARVALDVANGLVSEAAADRDHGPAWRGAAPVGEYA